MSLRELEVRALAVPCGVAVLAAVVNRCVAGIVVIAFFSTPIFHAFGTDPAKLNTWVAYFPFVYIALAVLEALTGYVVLFRRLRTLRGPMRRIGTARAAIGLGMEFFVYSRPALEAARPHEVPHVIISITSGTSDVARLRTTSMCKGVLRLVFLDAAKPSEQHPEDQLFSREQARQVWRFVSEHHREIERIVVHCDAGKSRSPAVAAALCLAFDRDQAEFMGGRYVPNTRVYETLVDAYAQFRDTFGSHAKAPPTIQ